MGFCFLKKCTEKNVVFLDQIHAVCISSQVYRHLFDYINKVSAHLKGQCSLYIFWLLPVR